MDDVLAPRANSKEYALLTGRSQQMIWIRAEKARERFDLSSRSSSQERHRCMVEAEIQQVKRH